MRICQNHLEFISVGDTVDHVSDGASDSTEDCVSLLLLKPHSEFKSWTAFFVLFLDHFERNVSERFCQSAELAFDGDGS